MDGKERLILIVAAGDDMYPALKAKERLEVESVPPSQIRVGDVIVFHRYVPIAHRVLSILHCGSEYFFLTKGDRCRFVDSPVPYRKVIGKVLGKSLPMAFQTRNKILFALFLLWHLFIHSFLKNPVVRRLNKFMLYVLSLLKVGY